MLYLVNLQYLKNTLQYNFVSLYFNLANDAVLFSGNRYLLNTHSKVRISYITSLLKISTSLLKNILYNTFHFRDKQFRDVSMCSLPFLSPVLGIPTFFKRILRPVKSHNQWRPVSDVNLGGITSDKNLQCESSESEMELESDLRGLFIPCIRRRRV